ncbi:MAG TPA: MaoC/PaaZ C-terminal domain-containing protein [Candidatus Hydrogenedentes bacterium]|nr:MaoC/PaaZ C-terminal domain-containing protein [Candidatus Hydrogenedentota bacterium]HQE83511.1 MaoC/PaaZ C-terminal domain-containing protein [Candidatus Hydrogenedentota bacterium]HQH51744.1 MaoC/PaaZ C-terminal domain-containing protein [Candidatus Hydrogenedentota bacterium]HQM50340.1 MaoC/PaaZ C-terminal domain-containing protein [Candidatus Hydrogenedentota bacterium]
MALQLDSQHVGCWTKPRFVEVGWRESMNFAASVGDNNPYYFDDTREGGIIAPPMLVAALTWPIYVKRHEFWGMEGWPEEVYARQVHLTEAIIMHRPLRPGDSLAIRGQIYGVLPQRGGTLSIVRFEAEDANGEPVFTEYGGAFYRGVRCADEGRTDGEIYAAPPVPETNGVVWDETIHIDPLTAHVYDGCTDLSFPIHTSKKFAQGVGLPAPILQGTATLAISLRELVNREAAGEPARLKELSCTFRGMVIPGSDIHLRLLAKNTSGKGVHLFYEAFNDQGKKAIADGYVLLSA